MREDGCGKTVGSRNCETIKDGYYNIRASIL
jgi:hypothetical protein